jgi:hypothetical protein
MTSSKGMSDLNEMLAALAPKPDREDYVFCHLGATDQASLAALKPFAMVRESEGITLVLDRETAERAELSFEGVFRKITLNVHSSLQAVGLTAAVAGALAEQDISANIIAAYYHDHVFVPSVRAAEALAAIRALS